MALMLKESGFVKSNKKIVLTALLINIATVLVCILFFSPAFEREPVKILT